MPFATFADEDQIVQHPRTNSRSLRALIFVLPLLSCSLPSEVRAQREPVLSGVVCHSIDDIFEIIDRDTKLDRDNFKAYWFAKKEKGECLYSRGQDPQFFIEDANIAELEITESGQVIHIIVVRGRLGTRSGPVAYSFQQFSSPVAKF